MSAFFLYLLKCNSIRLELLPQLENMHHNVSCNRRSSSVRPFLENILELQIFRQFIEDRLQMLNDGKGSSDEFEKEIIYFAEKLSKSNSAKIKTQAVALGTSVKKEGGAIVKAVSIGVKTQGKI